MSFKTYRTVALMACWMLLPACLLADDKNPQDKDRKDQAPPSSPAEPADRISKVERGLSDLKARIDAIEVQGRNLSSAIVTDFDNIQRTLQKIQSGLDTLRGEVDAMRNSTRTNNYGPRDPIPAPAPSTSGRADLSQSRIQLINSRNQVVVVTLDAQDYVLRPGQTKTIPHVPGTFTYEVHGLTLPRTRTLTADATPMVIEVYDR